jgi:hypothetical protein
MASSNQHSNSSSQSPTVAVLVGLTMVMFFCTVLWVAARREVANIYGVLRSIEFPFIWRYVPGSGNFDRSTLVAGHRPPLESIFINSVYFGFVFFLLIIVLMLLGLMRIEKYSIRKHLQVPSSRGLPPERVMEMYAETVPYVRFYCGYDLLSMSTIEGDARQPMRAMEVIEAAGALRGLEEDYSSGRLPYLVLDEPKLLSWFQDRMGPENPFLGLDKPALERAPEIHEAIAKLPWTTVLILYPALWRKHAFLVEDEDGFETTEGDVNKFIERIWSEMSAFKDEFGDRLRLGFDNEEQRRIQNSLFQEAQGKKKRKRKKGKQDGHDGQDGLITFGELLAERGPGLKVVEEAYNGLRRILTCHLGRDTELYPLRKGSNGCIEYGKSASTASEQAFMDATMKKLDQAAGTLAKETIFAHHYLYGLVGGALDNVRRTGIMPPHQFNWIRFYDKPLWYFVQNLGMPSAIPENAASFEHYCAERVAKTAISAPYIRTSIDGLRKEAEKYLDDDELSRIRETYGAQAIRHEVAEMSRNAVVERLLTQAGSAAAGGSMSPKPSEDAPEPLPATAEASSQTDGVAHEEQQPAAEIDPEEAMLRKTKEGLKKFF